MHCVFHVDVLTATGAGKRVCSKTGAPLVQTGADVEVEYGQDPLKVKEIGTMDTALIRKQRTEYYEKPTRVSWPSSVNVTMGVGCRGSYCIFRRGIVLWHSTLFARGTALSPPLLWVYSRLCVCVCVRTSS